MLICFIGYVFIVLFYVGDTYEPCIVALVIFGYVLPVLTLITILFTWVIFCCCGACGTCCCTSSDDYEHNPNGDWIKLKSHIKTQCQIIVIGIMEIIGIVMFLLYVVILLGVNEISPIEHNRSISQLGGTPIVIFLPLIINIPYIYCVMLPIYRCLCNCNLTYGERIGHCLHCDGEKRENRNKCAICKERDINIILNPCQHVCICSHCYERMLIKPNERKNCPICRSSITGTMNAIISV